MKTVEFGLLLLLCLSSFPVHWAQSFYFVTLVVDGSVTIAETDSNFICATMDWWPSTKCNYGHCPWGSSSALNLNLSHPLLSKAVKAFKHLRIRVGGSLQDQLLYDVGNLNISCRPFRKEKGGLFGFSKGCLSMDRWAALNHFFRQTRAIVTFGLNALHGRLKGRKQSWHGDWDSQNACDFIMHSITMGYEIDSWEFGNELSGSGVGANVNAKQYGKDLINLRAIIDELYEKSPIKASSVAPGGFFFRNWFAELLNVSGPYVINIVTFHLYNLGPGSDPHLVSKILDPNYLDRVKKTYSDVHQTIAINGPWASSWVGESGGAYNSGGREVSNTFVNSFWYVDQLGMASKFNTKVYCRQTLIGGNYGLLNATTFVPNPDYYSALLWHLLMGKGVLAVDAKAIPYIRYYAHCSKGRPGVTLLLINLSKETNFKVIVQNGMKIAFKTEESSNSNGSSFVRSLKRTVSWVGEKASAEKPQREEYHLTAPNRKLQSRIMLLNGKPLQLTDAGDIPALKPIYVDVKELITVASLSMAFIVLPNFDAPGCR